MQSVCDVHVTKGFNPEAPCAASPALLWLGGTISILLPTAVFLKVPSNFCRNLIISHLVHCFNADDASTKFISLETFLQLTLGLTRAKYQNRFCITTAPRKNRFRHSHPSQERACYLAVETIPYYLKLERRD
jgi:hypothetical protein